MTDIEMMAWLKSHGFRKWMGWWFSRISLDHERRANCMKSEWRHPSTGSAITIFGPVRRNEEHKEVLEALAQANLKALSELPEQFRNSPEMNEVLRHCT